MSTSAFTLKNKPIKTAIAAIYIAICLIELDSQITAQTNQPPLVVANISYNLEKMTVDFDLLNTSVKPITAWSLSIVTKYADNSEHESGLIQDFYISTEPERLQADASRPHKSGPLLPGQIRHDRAFLARVRGKAPDVVDVSLTVKAVIFSDTSSAGDSKHIREIFDHRAGEHKERAFWLQHFREVLQKSRSEDPVQLLRDLKQQIESRSSTFVGDLNPHVRYGATSVKTTLLRYVNLALKQAEANRERAGLILSGLVDRVEREYIASLNSLGKEN